MVALIVFIYLISVFWSYCFIGWAVDKDIKCAEMMFVSLCPILNTIFAGYRTYRHFKNSGRFFIKDLFAD